MTVVELHHVAIDVKVMEVSRTALRTLGADFDLDLPAATDLPMSMDGSALDTTGVTTAPNVLLEIPIPPTGATAVPGFVPGTARFTWVDGPTNVDALIRSLRIGQAES